MPQRKIAPEKFISLSSMKYTIFKIPFIGKLFWKIKNRFDKQFPGSSSYWVQRYEIGGNSGLGSYNELALFKANVINSFVENNSIQTVIEFGCGDGNQLLYAKYNNYIGFDISSLAIEICRKLFSADPSKSFFVLTGNEDLDNIEHKAELTLSLDVIYHLVEDAIFEKYMSFLFESSEKFVCIYSSNKDDNKADQATHVKHRIFSSWVENHQPRWQLIKMIPNVYPYDGNDRTSSFSDFYFYQKIIKDN